ncbi:MAG: hypothetical protein J1E81_06160 [Eubacterium sp.]|nr:hypothetical protein [Eubacterium sp.]
MNGYQPKNNRIPQPPPPKKPTPTPIDFSQHNEQSLEELARECRERGNRLEVMNGKAYEVTRKYIRDVD